MNLEIRKLTPELAADYIHFFDTTLHDDNIDEHKCYCVCWCSDNCEGRDFSTREKRRIYAAKYIGENILQGYLAYCDNKIVGWCNANTKADCLKCAAWRRNMASIPTDELAADAKVKSLFCFTIAPEMYRKGIATQLLRRVCRDAALDGFDFAEAYPNKKLSDNVNDKEFMGYAEMYRQNDFFIYHETEQKYVMRKQLLL